jgi:phage gpG-like protein
MKGKLLSAVLAEGEKAALQDLADWIGPRFVEEIEDIKWGYNTPPEVRDIVDTGRLRDSMEITVTQNGVTADWDVPYATQVHEGGVSTRTRKPFPGRPWTELPLEEAPKKMNEFLDKRLKAV